MTAIEWEDVPDFDDRPKHGPPCPGYETHRWTLTIEAGDITLHSGCPECDMAIETYEITAELSGQLSFEHAHLGQPCPNALRWLPCDCNYWYRFTIDDEP